MATQLNEDYLKKLIAEREANRLSAAQQGTQNPEPYNPRVEWLNNAMQNSMNRKTPLTMEQVMAQLKGTAINPNAGSYNPQINAANAAQQMQNQIQQNQTGQNIYTPSTFDNAAPYAQNYQQTRTQPQTPQADFGGAGGKQTGTQTAAYGTDENPYKQGQVIESNGKKYFYNATGKDFVSEDQVKANPTKYAEFNNILNPPKKTYKDPLAQAKANLDVLEPVSPLSNPMPQILQLSERFDEQIQKLGENAANPVGMEDQTSAAEALKQSMGASDTEKALQQKLMDFMAQGGQQKYADNEYNRIANQLNYAAQLQKEKDAADLASRGLGMSTIVSDVNSVTNRDLLHELQKTGYDAEKLGQDFMTDLFSKGTTLENNIGTRTGTNATKLSEIGGKKADTYGNAQNAYNNAIAYQDANTAANLALQNQAWQNDVNNFKWFAELPFAVNKSGDTAASLANSTAQNVYNSQVQGAANDNTNWMNLAGAGLTSWLTKGLK